MNRSVAKNPKTMWAAITDPPPTVGGRVLKISVLCFLAAVLLAASLGTVTYRFAGSAGVAAMGAALMISLISNVAGALPACWYLSRPEPPDAKDVLGGMAVRLVVLLLLAAPVVFSDLFPSRPLLLWLAGGYFALLMLETAVVARWMGQHQRMRET